MAPLLFGKAHRTAVDAGPPARRPADPQRAGGRPLSGSGHGHARQRGLRRHHARPVPAAVPPAPAAPHRGRSHRHGAGDDRGFRRDPVLRNAGAPVLGRGGQGARHLPRQRRALPGAVGALRGRAVLLRHLRQPVRLSAQDGFAQDQPLPPLQA